MQWKRQRLIEKPSIEAAASYCLFEFKSVVIRCRAFRVSLESSLVQNSRPGFAGVDDTRKSTVGKCRVWEEDAAAYIAEKGLVYKRLIRMRHRFIRSMPTIKNRTSLDKGRLQSTTTDDHLNMISRIATEYPEIGRMRDLFQQSRLGRAALEDRFSDIQATLDGIRYEEERLWKLVVTQTIQDTEIVPKEKLQPDDLCLICYAPLAEHEGIAGVVRLSCRGRHVFGSECVQTWFMESMTCPMDREHVDQKCTEHE